MSVIKNRLRHGSTEHHKVLLRNEGDRCNLAFRSLINAEIPPEYIHMFQRGRDHEFQQCSIDPHSGNRGEYNLQQCVIINMTDKELEDAIFSETHVGDSRKAFESKTKFLSRFGLTESVSIAPFGTVTVNGVELYDGKPVILVTGDIWDNFYHTDKEFDDLFTRMTWRVFNGDVGIELCYGADELEQEIRSRIKTLAAEKRSIVSEIEKLRTEVQELRSVYGELVRLAVEDSKRLCATPVGNPFDEVERMEFEKPTSLLSLF